jgi:hypothetical protein
MHRISADQSKYCNKLSTADNLLRGGKYRSSATIPQCDCNCSQWQLVQIAQWLFSTIAVIGPFDYLFDFVYLEPKCELTHLWILHLMFKFHSYCSTFHHSLLKQRPNTPHAHLW